MAGTARSQSTDPFSINRFHVVDSEGFLNLASPAAGFNLCTLPDMTIGMVEYQEGIYTYRRKYPGEVTFTPVTLSKGVVKTDSAFFEWVRACAENKSYRTNITIKHFHRDDVSDTFGGQFNNSTPSREYQCFNCLPTRVKPGSDFDSLGAEISIEEIDFEIEFFRLFIDGQEVQPREIG